MLVLLICACVFVRACVVQTSRFLDPTDACCTMVGAHSQRRQIVEKALTCGVEGSRLQRRQDLMQHPVCVCMNMCVFAYVCV